MDPEKFLATAEQHAEAGRFAAATVYATIATAAAATKSAGQSSAIYPGDHQPLPADWCGQCHSPGRRVINSKNCHRCNPRVLRARPCRYCGAYLEERMDNYGSEGSWAWRDERNSLNCPKAPNPTAPLTVPAQAERDVNPDAVWNLFFQEWKDNRALSEEPASAEELLAAPLLMPYMPRTRLGERPHVEHLDTWLAERAYRPYGSLQLVEEPTADGSSGRTWRLTNAVSAEPAGTPL